MWRIVGICKRTHRVVEIVVASCDAEKERVLSEERREYYGLKALRLRAA